MDYTETDWSAQYSQDEQESLPVECVSTAAVPPPVYRGIPWYQGYPPCGQTNTRENITFPQLRWR